MGHSSISFAEWIEKFGRVRLAKVLGVSKMTICFWEKGTYYPRPAQMRAIRKLSKGVITYEKMIDREEA